MSTLTLCVLLSTLQADPPPKGGVEEAIASALRNHPDVRVAEANRVLADAELEQTKQAVSKRVALANIRRENAAEKFAMCKQTLAIYERHHQQGQVTAVELGKAQAELAAAKAELMTAEEEVKSAVVKNHPDIKVAEAKRLVADAVADQARLTVTQKVAPAFARIQAAKVKVQGAEENLQRMNALSKNRGGAMVPQQEVERATHEVQLSKAELAAAEAELKAITGDGAKADADPTAAKTAARLADYMRVVQNANTKVVAATPSGSAADKLRALLDKPIKLDIKAGPFSDVMPEFLKQTGLDAVTVRYPTWASAKTLKTPPTVGPFTGEKTLTAWLELLMDEFQNPGQEVIVPGGIDPGPYVVVVREYGLLIVGKKSAPPDALTLTEFAKLVRAEKEAKK